MDEVIGSEERTEEISEMSENMHTTSETVIVRINENLNTKETTPENASTEVLSSFEAEAIAGKKAEPTTEVENVSENHEDIDMADDKAKKSGPYVTAGLFQICKLFAQVSMEKCQDFACTKEKRDMLDVIAKLVEGLEFLLKSLNTLYPKMSQIARIGQNTSKVFNLGINFEDELIFNWPGINDLEKLINLVRDRFPSLAPVDEIVTKKPRVGDFSATSSSVNLEQIDETSLGPPLAYSTPAHEPLPCSSEESFMNSKFLQLSNGVPGMMNGNKDFKHISKIQSEDIIELSDDEDTTLKKSKTPQPKPKPVNKPSTSKIQANSSKASHKRTNGMIYAPLGNQPHPVAVVPPYNSNCSLPNTSNFNAHRPNILNHQFLRTASPRIPQIPLNNFDPINQVSPTNIPRPLVNNDPPIRSKLFEAVCGRQYFAANILMSNISQFHPKPLPLTNNVDPNAPNLKNITANTIHESNNYCCVHLFVEFEYKYHGQKLFLLYYLKSQAENVKETHRLPWADGGSHNCNQSGATVIKMRFQDVRPDETLFVSLRLGTDTQRGSYSIPLSLSLGQPLASIAVQFNEQHQIVTPEAISQPALIEID